MQQDWVLDVLADLRAFARSNSLSTLAEQLDDTIMVAAADIERYKAMSAEAPGANEREAGNSDNWLAASDIIR